MTTVTLSKQQQRALTPERQRHLQLLKENPYGLTVRECIAVGGSHKLPSYVSDLRSLHHQIATIRQPNPIKPKSPIYRYKLIKEAI